MSASEVTASPCNRICTLGDGQICIGCGRHLDEITAWSAASEAQRREICARAAERLSRRPPPLKNPGDSA